MHSLVIMVAMAIEPYRRRRHRSNRSGRRIGGGYFTAALTRPSGVNVTRDAGKRSSWHAPLAFLSCTRTSPTGGGIEATGSTESTVGVPRPLAVILVRPNGCTESSSLARPVGRALAKRNPLDLWLHRGPATASRRPRVIGGSPAVRR